MSCRVLLQSTVKQFVCPKKKTHLVFCCYESSSTSARLRALSKSLPPPEEPPQYRDASIKWFLFTVPVVTFGLGCWQVYRRRWKIDLIKSLEEKTATEPVELPASLSELEELEYRPVKVIGHFLHDREVLFGPRSLIKPGSLEQAALISSPNTNQGYLVITPFQLHDRDQVILVNRGWVPKKMKHANVRQAGQLEGEVELTGVVRLNEKRGSFVMKNDPPKGHWFYRDVDTMAEFARTAPIWLDVKGNPDPAPGYPIPNQTRIRLRNEHLTYLITWFGLSISTGALWHRLFILKKPLR